MSISRPPVGWVETTQNLTRNDGPKKIALFVDHPNIRGQMGIIDRLVKHENISPESYQFEVVALSAPLDNGTESVADWMEEAGIPTHHLNIDLEAWDDDIHQTAKTVGDFIKEKGFDVVHGWDPISNVLNATAARLHGHSAGVLWSLHDTDPFGDRQPPGKQRAIAAMAELSGNTVTMCCTKSTKDVYGTVDEKGRLGLKNLVVVYNGVDTDHYRPDPDLGAQTRRQWGVDDDAQLIGISARYDQVKDYPTFIEAAGMTAKSHPDVTFVMCGPGVETSNAELMQLIEKAGISDNVLILGGLDQEEMPAFYNAIDVLAMSSISEALSMAALEAKACGTPCISTDVGDMREAAGGDDRVYPTQDPQAMASVMNVMLERSATKCAEDAQQARDDVEKKFGMKGMVEEYYKYYDMVYLKQQRDSPRNGHY